MGNLYYECACANPTQPILYNMHTLDIFWYLFLRQQIDKSTPYAHLYSALRGFIHIEIATISLSIFIYISVD